MTVVADSSPLVILAKLGCFDLLNRLFPRLYISSEVHHEVVVAGVGLLPAAWSEGIGSQVQKPLAVVVVTGMMLAPLVILVTLPVLISVFSRRAR